MRVLFPFVGDSIEYKNEQNKSEGYSIKYGKKESVIDQEVSWGRPTKKKLTKKSVPPISLSLLVYQTLKPL